MERPPNIMSECHPDPPLPLLITGLTGVAGYNAFHYFHRRYPGNVIGIRQVSNWPLQGKGIVPCDAEDGVALRSLFDKYQFRSVLNTAGNCALKSCELDPEMAWRVNHAGLRTLLETIEETPVKLVHLSIDLVFSGESTGNYKERHRTDPVTVYGKSMAAAEELVTLVRPDACTLRISLPMGVSYGGHAGAIDWIQSRFKQHKPATLYYDEIRTPTYTDCLNRVFQHVLASNLSGLYNAGGPRRLSLYQIAQVVNRIGGYDPQNLMGCYRISAGPMPPRAGNVSMDSRRLFEALHVTPLAPWPYFQEHVPTHGQWHFERTGGEPGSPQLLAQLLYRNPAVVIRGRDDVMDRDVGSDRDVGIDRDAGRARDAGRDKDKLRA